MPPIYKNGKYGYLVKVCYNGKQVARCNEHTRTKMDAKKYEIELMATLRDGLDVAALTFEELYYKFMDEKKRELKRNTLSYYKLVVPTYVFPMFKTRRIDSITKESIIKWKNWILEKYDFSLKYQNNIFTCFSAIMNYAVKLYDLPSNPLAKVGKFKNPNMIVKDDIDEYWTYEQFDVFIKKVYEHFEEQKGEMDRYRYHCYYTLYNILFYAGLRRSEAVALYWKDIITINGTSFIDVYKSINQRVSPYDIGSTKNKSSVRKVPIGDELMRVLAEHKELAKKIYGFNEDKFFIIGDVNPIAKNSVGEIKSRIEKECGLPHIKIHSFRHSYCSMLINANIPLFNISKLLGHSTTKITEQVYSHMYPQTNQQVINFMNSLNKKKGDEEK